jgi:hypothetical protein
MFCSASRRRWETRPISYFHCSSKPPSLGVVSCANVLTGAHFIVSCISRWDGHASSLALSPTGVVSYVSRTPSAAPTTPHSPPDAGEEAPRVVPRRIQPPWPIRDGPHTWWLQGDMPRSGPTGSDLSSVIFYFFKIGFPACLSNRHHRWFLVSAGNNRY